MIYQIMLKPEELQIVIRALLHDSENNNEADNVFAVIMAYKTIQEREAERRFME